MDDDAPPESAPPAVLAPDVVPAAALVASALAAEFATVEALDAGDACDAPVGVWEDACAVPVQPEASGAARCCLPRLARPAPDDVSSGAELGAPAAGEMFMRCLLTVGEAASRNETQRSGHARNRCRGVVVAGE
ncbi:hypothetical protein [Burkholderia perseverans]|uniref:hypothetical protein n=1 Tax=Burkholderia perseverans TaxID=2615214 RepID=UPI001FF03A1B|nr:hypothetical protein [Burkholderia perseverans]